MLNFTVNIRKNVIIKIKKIMDRYSIGKNAGTIWNLLSSDNKKWEYNDLKKATGLSDRDLNASIGWLAREDKIQFEIDKDGNKELLYLELNLYIG